MKVIYKIKQILFSPNSFFSSLKKEKKVDGAFGYFAIISLIGSVFFFLSVFFQWSDFSFFSFLNPSGDFGGLLIITIFIYGLGLGFSFVNAGVLHIWIKIFGGKSKYSKTYQLYVYTSTPTLLLSWIPFIGFLSSFYDLTLLIIGTPKIHKEINLNKSIFMYVIPVAVFVLLYFVMVGFSLFFLSQQSSIEMVGKAFGL